MKFEKIYNYDENSRLNVIKNVITIEDKQKLILVQKAIEELRDRYQDLYNNANHLKFEDNLPGRIEILNEMLKEFNNPEFKEVNE